MNSKEIGGYVSELVERMLEGKFKKATTYVNDKFVIKTTRRHKSGRNIEMVLTIGVPNYAEQKYIKRGICGTQVKEWKK